MILILDFGSQFTQLITRRIRELNVESRVVPGSSSLDRIRSFHPQAVILSGGPSSVYEENAPRLTDDFWAYQESQQIPILGICYGMQWIVQKFEGQVGRGKSKEYGPMGLRWENASSLYSHAHQKVWMSHGDETLKAPDGFQVTARSDSGAIAAIESASRKIFGIQFHPEVTHSENGIEVLKSFVFQISKIKPTWTAESLHQKLVQEIRDQLKDTEGKIICALSGGVDSTVAATLVHEAVGDRLECFFIDHGLLRFQERERVMKMFQDDLHLKVMCKDASDLFLSRLKGVSDPEEKRKIIGKSFIDVFEEVASEFEKRDGRKPSFLVQGTLYPDVIESSGTQHAVTIKSHHNVGGLPENLRFKLIEPLRDLFKDEVRALGQELGISKTFLSRHPFPGPGLGIRITGEVKPEFISILQKADEIYLEEIRRAGLYEKIWQAMAIFLPVKTVGVKGDGRVHEYVIALRAVTSEDGMTAIAYPFEPSFLAKVCNRICNEVQGVSRVVYDFTSKPPGTIEWE